MDSKITIDNIDIDACEEENVVHLTINYPRANAVDTVDIGLCDVRATDGIRVMYDFERDGWIIYQPRSWHPQIDEHSYGYKEEWIESAFVPSWKYALEEEEKFNYKETTSDETK
jgi:hypothetical protein